MESNRECPLMGRKISKETCYDIHMVAEGMAPERSAPKEAAENPDYKKICLNCKYHVFD